MNLDHCIAYCLDAAQSCEETLVYASSAEHTATDAALLTALTDAACVANLSADRLARLPELQGMLAQVCLEIVDRAALACARYADDDYLQACAEICATCGAACHELLHDAHADYAQDDASHRDDEMADIGTLLEAGLSERVSEIRYNLLSSSAA